MKRGSVIGYILCAVVFSSISVLGLTACGGDSGPTPSGLAITTTSLPEGQVNQPYSAAVGGSGGALPYLWSVTPALPAGLSFNTQSGAITGTPGTVGTSSHAFTLADSSIPPQTVEQSLSLTIKPPLSITTTSLPDGNIGAEYVQPVQTVGGFGPLTFGITSGTLPPGLSLDPIAGRISGTPTAPAGNFSFTVRVADTSGQQDTQALSIRINAPSPPQITTASLPAGTLGVAYGPTTIQASGGTGTLTWSITVGSLPPGLTGPPVTGPSVTISGTPTSQGTFPFTVRVTDPFGQVATRALSITINLPAPPNITITTLPAGTIAQTYNQAVLATGTAPLTWSLSAGSLPPGLNLSPTSGTITGAPTATGNFPFTVRVADTFGRSDTQALSILVSTDNPPQIVPPSLPSGTVGVVYGPTTLQATGGMGTLTWSISAGSLPPGLTIAPPLTGPSVTISGTPTSQGTFNFTVRVTDSLGQSDTRALSITINPPPPLNITTTSLPGGSIGQNYNQPVAATGGTAPLTWNISAGTLPAGLNLDATTGVISGTPILPSGASNFTVRVADAGGQDDTQDLSITISLFNVPNITTTTLQGGTVGQAYSQPVVATGGIGALTWSISAGTLPQGLDINPINGVISGTPTTAETANFTVRVEDTLGQSDTQALSIAVSAALAPLTITTSSPLPSGKEGEAYSTTLQSSGGLPPISWSVNPPLPDGLSLKPATGEISGTPGSGTGTGAPQTFTFTAQDSSTPTPQTANQPLDLTIDPP